jgi:hypothetical protein
VLKSFFLFANSDIVTIAQKKSMILSKNKLNVFFVVLLSLFPIRSTIDSLNKWEGRNVKIFQIPLGFLEEMLAHVDLPDHVERDFGCCSNKVEHTWGRAVLRVVRMLRVSAQVEVVAVVGADMLKGNCSV